MFILSHHSLRALCRFKFNFKSGRALGLFCRRGLGLTDALYIRGWEDCLEAIAIIVDKGSVPNVRKKISELQKLVRENKFERIRNELGAYHIF